jgi:raffinose/stachyose/melibiose transport system permease protein
MHTATRPPWLLLALLLLTTAPTSAATTLRVYAQAYTPEVSTGDNPKPLHAFTQLARRFEALHPGVRVEFLKNPVGEYRTWMITQLRGGTAPDIMWAHSSWTNEDARYGWFLNLDPYLDQSNPYVAPGQRGAVHWRDAFYPDATNAKRGPDGHLYSLPIDQVETAIFYNQDLFERAGVKPPKTWAEFIAIQERLRRAGIIPFEMTAGAEMVPSWARAVLLDQLWADRLPQMDVRRSSQGGFPGVDQQEFVRACRKGIFSARDRRYRELLRLLKQWSRYWQPGSLGNLDNRLFRLGRAAMFWNGSWYAPQIERDPMRTFRYGIFTVPPLTRESTPYALPGKGGADGHGTVRGVGGATSIQYAVTQMAVTAGKADLAVDFLRFITAPRQLGPLVSEAGLFLPNVIGLPGHPRLAPFVPVLRAGHVRFGGEQTTPRYADQSFRLLQSYLGDQTSEEETIGRLERHLAISVDQVLRDNAARWRFTSDGEILPPPPDDPAPPSGSPPVPWPLFAMGATAVAVGSAGTLRPGLRRHGTSYLFLVPTFILLILFSYYPIGSALYHAFTEWRGNGVTIWVGLANFRELLTDEVMGVGVANTVKLLLAHVLIALTVPLIVAEMIFALRSPRAQYFYRVMFVVPMVVPGVVLTLIWGFFYDTNLGLLNHMLEALGLGHWRQAWLGDAGLALYALMFMGFPWVGGFPLLIYYAGLQNIPTDVFDSARIDGAAGLSRFRHIDLPLLMGQVKLLLVLGFIGGLQGFQTQLLLTNGGPAYATMVPGMHMYQNAMTFDRMGYACAMGVALFLVILGITYLNLKYLRSGQELEA